MKPEICVDQTEAQLSAGKQQLALIQPYSASSWTSLWNFLQWDMVCVKVLGVCI